MNMSKMPIYNKPRGSNLEPQPLNPPKKALPLTPPEFYRVSVLEYENKMLRRENDELQAQIQALSCQAQYHREIAEAARDFAKSTSMGVKRLQDAAIRMNETNFAAKKKWDEFCEKEQDSRKEREAGNAGGNFM